LTDDVKFNGDDLADGSVSITKFADSITPVELGAGEPSDSDPDNFEGRTYTDINTGILYTFHDGEWTHIEADVLDGSITAAKLADSAVIASKLAANAVTAVKIADGAVAAAKIASAAIDTSKLADGAVTNLKLGALAVDAAKLAANAVTNTKIADDAVSTPKLQANSVVADKIAVNSIAARHVVISNTSNLVPDNQLQDATSWLNTPSNAWALNTAGGIGFASKGVWRFIVANKTTAFAQCISEPIPVEINKDYRARAQAYVGAGVSAQVLIRVNWLDSTGANLSQSIIGNVVITANTFFDVPVTAPTGATTAVFAFYVQQDNTNGDVYFGSPYLKDKDAASLIVDGGITSNSLAANSVTAGKIATNAVTAGTIAAGAVTAATIAANSVTSDKIVANSITARELVLTDFSNIIPDWNNMTAGWTIGAGVSYVAGNTVWRSYNLLAYTVPVGATGFFAVGYSARFTVGAGEKYQAYVQNSSSAADGNYGAWVRIDWFDRSGVALTGGEGIGYSTVQPNAAYTGYHDNNAEVTVPNGAFFARITCYINQNVTTNHTTPVYFGGTMLRRKGDANLIVDGQITTDKLAANAITAGKIAANAVTAGTVAAGAINTTQLAAGAITTAKLSTTDLQVSSAMIANAAITSHKIRDLEVGVLTI